MSHSDPEGAAEPEPPPVTVTQLSEVAVDIVTGAWAITHGQQGNKVGKQLR